MRTGTIVQALAIIALALGACRGKSGEGAASMSLNIAAPIVAAPGAEPRTAFRYAKSTTARTTTIISGTARDGGATLLDPGSAMNFTVKWVARKQAGSRGFRVEKAAFGAGAKLENVSAGELAIMESVAKSFVGVEGRVEVEPGGALRFAKSSGGPTQPEFVELLSMICVPLPGEAVGVGARWSAVGSTKTQSVLGALTHHYEIVAANNGRLTIAISGGGDLQGGLSVELAGSVVISVDDVLPQSGQVVFTQTIVDPDIEQPMKISSLIRIDD